MVLKSVNYKQEDAINDILNLHNYGNSIDIDLNYSIGGYYKSGKLIQPRYKFDKYPKNSSIYKLEDVETIIPNESANCVSLDPPFVISYGKSVGENCENIGNPNSNKTSDRFGGFRNFQELKDCYRYLLTQSYRVLKEDGICIFKIQDTISSSKQYISHYFVMKEAIKLGFYVKDLTILASNRRLISGKHKNQQHLRKFHSYFITLKKTNKIKIDYE